MPDRQVVACRKKGGSSVALRDRSPNAPKNFGGSRTWTAVKILQFFPDWNADILSALFKMPS